MSKLILAVIFFLISLLTIFKAQAYYLWILAILVDEFPWVPVILSLLLLLFCLRSTTYSLQSSVLTGAAFILFLSPVFRASLISSNLPEAMSQVFGNVPNSKDNIPFRLAGMFSKSTEVPYLTVPYKKTKEKELTLDYYPSRIPGKRPCIVIVHGGSWESGDNKQLPELNSLLSKQGYHVAAINYRLAPGAQSPAPVEDVKDAIRFLKGHAVDWNIDTAQFVLLGRSAGAQIALLAAYSLKDPDVKGVIDFYGPADMVWGYSIPSNPLIMDSRKVMENYVGGTYQSNPEKFEKSSPLLYVSRDSPPTLLIHGANDVLVAYEHSRRLNLKLQENGVRHYFLTLPWATHGFDFNINGPGGQLSTYAVLYFLKSVTQ